MATKKELEFEKAAREQEAARKAKAAGPVRITIPEDAPGPRTTVPNPLAGSGRTGGFSAQDAADIGGVFVRPRTRVGETPEAPPPGQLDPAITGVKTPATPAQTEAARAAEPAATGTPDPNALRETFLAQQGVPADVQAQDPSVFNAPGTGQFQRRQRIGAGGESFVNLGSFETEGGPDIFGRASEAGGPINTFVGAGTPDPTDPTTTVAPGAERLGGRFAEGFRGTGVTPELQQGIDAFRQRAASGGNLRAGNRAFGGGAASGGGNDVLRQINRINSRADKAFQQALSQGMNTKAAARIADSIRDGASQVNFADRTAAGERTATAQIESSERTAQLKNIGDLAKLDAEQRQAIDEADFEDLKGLAFTANEETGVQEFNQALFSETLLAAGGRQELMGLSSATKGTLFNQGSNTRLFLNNINSFLAREGRRADNIGDLLKGAQLTGDGKIAQSHATLLDALKSKTIDIGDIFGEKITLGDGTELPLGELIGEDVDLAKFTLAERNALIEIIE